MNLPVPKNLGDVIYSFRSRKEFPVSIKERTPDNCECIIRSEGNGLYAFVLEHAIDLSPIEQDAVSIPDATPPLVKLYSQSDEQAILAKIRYNGLIGFFTNLVCYHLQSHYKTQVSGIGQTETDDLYVAYDHLGRHSIILVQAKSQKEKLSRIQIENDLAVCEVKFPSLQARSIAAKQISKSVVALMEFGYANGALSRVQEVHYKFLTLQDAIVQQ